LSLFLKQLPVILSDRVEKKPWASMKCTVKHSFWFMTHWGHIPHLTFHLITTCPGIHSQSALSGPVTPHNDNDNII
jgi:hypothetical protein